MTTSVSIVVGERIGRARALALVALAALYLAACTGSTSPDATTAGAGPEPGCTPACEGLECGPDGCGGSCGVCVEPLACDSAGRCAEPPGTPGGSEGCTETCAEAGFECGEICGVPCGTCPGEGSSCVDGLCACSPTCNASLCGRPDGCGGSCGPCPSAQSCEGCALKLSLVDQVEKEGLVREITLALDYEPGAGKPLPTMADLRLDVSGSARLVAVGIAPAVLEARKDLLPDPDTGKPFRVLKGGHQQILVMSTANTTAIQAGRWLLLRFELGPQGLVVAEGWAAAPAVIRLVQREETFAPPPADQVLWGGGPGEPVVVWAAGVVGSDNDGGAP